MEGLHSAQRERENKGISSFLAKAYLVSRRKKKKKWSAKKGREGLKLALEMQEQF